MYKYIVICLILILLSGCVSSTMSRRPVLEKSVSNSMQLIQNTVKSSDWLMSAFLIAIVLGVFSGFNGLKTGWCAAGASLLGLILKSAMTQTWVYWSLGVLLIAGVLLVAASILMRKRALVEIIKGVQRLKEAASVCTEPEKLALAKTQSKPTQRIVAAIKTDLKLKGDI